MGSPTHTVSDRLRITYIEEANVSEMLNDIASQNGLSVSHLIREATWQYMKRCKAEKRVVVDQDKKRVRPASVKRKKTDK